MRQYIKVESNDLLVCIARASEWWESKIILSSQTWEAYEGNIFCAIEVVAVDCM